MSPFTRARAIGYLVAVFLAGGVAGGFIGYGYAFRRAMRPPDPSRLEEHMLSHLRRRLELTPEQVNAVRPMLGSAAEDLRQTHLDSMQKVDATFLSLNARLRPHLDPEQVRKLEAMERERQVWMKPPPPATNATPTGSRTPAPKGGGPQE